MKISKKSRREAKDLFRACIANGALDENRVRRVVAKVIELKPRRYAAILSHLYRLVKLELDRRTARVESVIALAPGLEADLKNRLGRIYGAGLEFAFSQNPALLGGVRIRVGSDVYDGTVRARLDALADSF